MRVIASPRPRGFRRALIRVTAKEQTPTSAPTRRRSTSDKVYGTVHPTAGGEQFFCVLFRAFALVVVSGKKGDRDTVPLVTSQDPARDRIRCHGEQNVLTGG